MDLPPAILSKHITCLPLNIRDRFDAEFKPDTSLTTLGHVFQQNGVERYHRDRKASQIVVPPHLRFFVAARLHSGHLLPLLMSPQLHEHVACHDRTDRAYERGRARLYKGLTLAHFAFFKAHCIHPRYDAPLILDPNYLVAESLHSILSASGLLDFPPFKGLETNEDTIMKRIIWVSDGAPRAGKISIGAGQGVELPKTWCRYPLNAFPPCFQPDNVKALNRKLGKNYVCADRDTYLIHQSILTMSELERITTGLAVEMQPWDWLYSALQQDKLPLVENEYTLVFLDCTCYPHPHDADGQLQFVYDRLRRSHAAGFPVYCWPTEKELHHDISKVEDIALLDDIASRSPYKYAFRPKTCTGNVPCGVEGPSVYKRKNSSAASHVLIDPSSQTRPIVQCRQGASDHQKTMAGDWFHQEYVPNLRIQEFRVIITTERDPTALRHRAGRVAAVLQTQPISKSTMIVHDAREDHRTVEGKRSLQGLEDFALYVFEQMRAHSTWMSYPSLEVGARMDIGVSQDEENGRFFVNEVTRIHFADLFQSYMSEPKTQMSRKIARALANVFCPSLTY